MKELKCSSRYLTTNGGNSLNNEIQNLVNSLQNSLFDDFDDVIRQIVP